MIFKSLTDHSNDMIIEEVTKEKRINPEFFYIHMILNHALTYSLLIIFESGKCFLQESILDPLPTDESVLKTDPAFEINITNLV